MCRQAWGTGRRATCRKVKKSKQTGGVIVSTPNKRIGSVSLRLCLRDTQVPVKISFLRGAWGASAAISLSCGCLTEVTVEEARGGNVVRLGPTMASEALNRNNSVMMGSLPHDSY